MATHRFRQFIGLALLIVLLIVASVPALLEPTAEAVEQAAVKFGVIEKPKAPEPVEKDGKPVDDPADPRLAVRGYVVEEDGDLRDTLEPADRDAMLARTRLRSGADRVLLPGQRAREASAVPPAGSEDGVLLDVTGCPQFRPDTDVAVLLANPETQALYASKVEEADDPAACAPLLQERIAAATAPATVPAAMDRATARDRASLRRGSAGAMLIGLSELELLTELLDEEGLAEALAALDEPAPAAGGTVPGSTRSAN